MEKIIYPIRINRYLALKNICSRREADDFIKKGIITINGRVATLGDKMHEKDVVIANTSSIRALKQCQYVAYNKPRGIVTHSPIKGQEDIREATRLSSDIFPVGRLDRESHGLIILTNDGRITDKLLNPERNHEKEYVVKVNKPITNIFLKVMQQGVQLEDFKTKPCTVEKKDDLTFRIILTEGKKHQIRRMCASLGWVVNDLKRVRIMNVRLAGLKIGQYRNIQGKELRDLLEILGLKEAI